MCRYVIIGLSDDIGLIGLICVVDVGVDVFVIGWVVDLDNVWLGCCEFVWVLLWF